MASTIARWGNSLAVRLPREIAARARLVEGSAVAIDVAEDGTVELRPAGPRYRLDDLLDGVTQANLHDETDWGGPTGRETW